MFEERRCDLRTKMNFQNAFKFSFSQTHFKASNEQQKNLQAENEKLELLVESGVNSSNSYTQIFIVVQVSSNLSIQA